MFAPPQYYSRASSPASLAGRRPAPVARTAASHGNWHRLATSLPVSRPEDASEREADRVADAVMRGQGAGAIQGATGGVQRMCAECEEELREGGMVHPKREAAGEPDAAGFPVLSGLEGDGHPLPAPIRGEFEARFGRDFGDVRVHTGGQASESAQSFDALAYTYGRHVVFGAGQFDPSSMQGRRLIAHELAHVVQQSRHAQPALQRQVFGGPLDLKLDPCVVTPWAGTLCGQAAADACKKASWIPGCSLVCKVFDCSKPKEPSTQCPPGWRAAGSKGFEGQCCKGSIDSANACCTPGRIATAEDRCCKPGEVVSDNRCKKSSEIPPIFTCLPWQRTLLGECCFPPLVPKGLECGLPDIKPPTPQPKPPVPVLPKATEIFFKRDRPWYGEGGGSLSSAATQEGYGNFKALAENLKNNPDLRVQLVGRASPEGSEAYNLELGARRARMVAEALKAAGVSESQIADPPTPDLAPECQSLGPGLATCGKANATGERDRQVLARSFQSSAP